MADKLSFYLLSKLEVTFKHAIKIKTNKTKYAIKKKTLTQQNLHRMF
jgi:hypothetical protein